jgi:Transglutaminase-like superfamily
MENECGAADPASVFERLAARTCPDQAELLSAAGAAAVGEPARPERDFALDDLGRRLFGYTGDGAGDAAGRLGELLAGDPGFVVDENDPRALLLDWVIPRRVGHPLLLAVVLAEAGRRAGMRTGVFSSPHAWYAGVSDMGGIWLVETGEDRNAVAPQQVRGHCAHELAWAVLAGLERSLLRRADRASATRARVLRGMLPTGYTGVGDPLGVLWADQA